MNIPTIDVKRRTDQHGLIKFHLINKLIFEMNQDVIHSDIVILAYLISQGNVELRKFCYDVARKLYPSINPEEYAIKEQNIRNRVNKLEKRGFIVKNKKHNKTISIHSDLKVNIPQSVLYKYSLLYV